MDLYYYMLVMAVMETIGKDFEKNNLNLSEESWQPFDANEYKKQLNLLEKRKNAAQKAQQRELEGKIGQLFENGDKNIDSADKREKVQEFIRNNCSEPIEWVDRIVQFEGLVWLLIESAENENLPEVKESIEKWNAKDKRIYELPAYKELIEKWFVLPSDVRTYYDSANREPVYHLWVDYNVKAGTEVKSMYDWKVVESWLDGGLWHKVIIEHTMPDWTKFYSLYGHLGSESLPGIWDEVKKGMKIWEVWKPFTKENWDWEEHLHFQIMENVDSDRWYYGLKEEEIKEEEKEKGRELKDEEKVELAMEKTKNYNVLESFGK